MHQDNYRALVSKNGDEGLHLLHSSTRVVMADGSVREMKDLKVGDVILGARYRCPVYRYCLVEVTAVSPRMEGEAFMTILRDDRIIVSSSSLMLLTDKSWRRGGLDEIYNGTKVQYQDQLQGLSWLQMRQYENGAACAILGIPVSGVSRDLTVMSNMAVGIRSDMMWIEVEGGCFIADGVLVHDHTELKPEEGR